MKRVWTDDMDKQLRRAYKDGSDLRLLAQRLGVTYCAVKSRASHLGIHRRRAYGPWTVRQIAYLKRHYADTDTRTIMEKVKKSEKSVYQMAAKLELHKSKEYLAEIGRRSSQNPNCIACRFKKGHTPANKGKRDWQFRSPEAIARVTMTQFKPGHQPHNTKSVGYERINDDGYIMIKVEEGKKMVLKHRWVWEQAHGVIPRGYNIMFRDGNRLNCSLDNLELVSRAEAARRQVDAETPEQRKARLEKSHKTRNKTIRRDRIRIHWGMEPKTKLVKRW